MWSMTSTQDAAVGQGAVRPAPAELYGRTDGALFLPPPRVPTLRWPSVEALASVVGQSLAQPGDGAPRGRC